MYLRLCIMSLTENFSSAENKSVIWSFMQKNNFFDDIPDDKSAIVQEKFEMNIKEYCRSFESNDTLVSLNKKTLKSMHDYLKGIQNKRVRFSGERNFAADKNVTTIEEEVQKRQEEFNTRLSGRQKEFDEMISKKIPEEPNFSDNIREIQIKNMEEHIEKTVSQRDNELNNIFNQNNSIMNTRMLNNVNRPKLNIVENCTIKEEDIHHVKIQNIPNVELTEIKETIGQIQKDQKTILKMLETIKIV